MCVQGTGGIFEHWAERQHYSAPKEEEDLSSGTAYELLPQLQTKEVAMATLAPGYRLK
jgi:hypothetical protein